MYHHMPKGGNSHRYVNKIKWEEILKKEDRRFAELTLRRRKSVCVGYAVLFAELCTEVGLQAQVVQGYALNYDNKVKNISKNASNHAWNVVSVNDQWRLIDVTWASGFCDKDVKTFTRKLDLFYFFTPPEQFILNHRPVGDVWQLMDKPVSVKEFVENAQNR
jgi:transglutaminase/protease-like cytokinesis protein 3